MTNQEKQADEILVLQSIFDQKFRLLDQNQYEIIIEFELPNPITIRFNDQTSTIQYLPQFSLIIHYHDEYPSIQPPAFVLSCIYFSKNQLQKLCQKLDAYPFQCEVCVYEWINLIRHEINEELIVDTSDPSEVGNYPRALNGYFGETASKIFQYLINYNRESFDKQFLNRLQTCLICTETLPGSQCIRLHNCGHFYCDVCLNNYVQMTLNNGNFGEKLHCPDSHCKQPLLPTEVRQALQNDELYEKYERITLQNGLALMTDITWCPRCQTPVVIDNRTGNLGMCYECCYTFCRKCQEIYHFQAICPKDFVFEQLKLQRKKEDQRMEKQRKEALAKLLDAEKHRRSALEEKTFNEKYRMLEIKLSEQDKLLEEFLNAERMDLLQTQQCPHCRVQIEKVGGCSRIHCSNCYNDFSWNVMGLSYNSNEFSSLTDGIDLDFAKVAFNHVATTIEISSLEMDEKNDTSISIDNRSLFGAAILQRVKKCPSKLCNTINMKVNQDNWIVCNKCMKQFCFLCSRTIKGNQHFDDKCERYTPI